MLRRPDSLQMSDEVWDSLPHEVKLSFYARQGQNESNPNPIDPALTTGTPGMRHIHDPYHDGPSGPYPYQGLVAPAGSANASHNRSTRPVVNSTPQAQQMDDRRHRGRSRECCSVLPREQRALRDTAVKTLKLEFIISKKDAPLLRPRALPPPTQASSDELRLGRYDDDAEDVSQSSRELSDVGKEACRELKAVGMAVCLEDRKVKWDKNTLYVFAKDTYCQLKEDWHAQNNPVKNAAKVGNQRGNRWTQRCKEKAEQLILARDAYIAKYGVDPVPVVYADHMSDEASGPEDDTDQSRKEWEMEMATKAGLAADGDLEGLNFLEVLKSPWRSEELGNVYHELHDLWCSSLTAKQKKCFHSIRVHATQRQSTRIHTDMPYNFGIDLAWLDVNKNLPGLQDQLTDWGKWDDPEGFGSKKPVEQREQGTAQSHEDETGPSTST
ncbi:hypothetical protein PAXINDRAFT_156253 [Paxillus involutus ATCC 200175]|uniref:Uncharacterized protein n=1 Tax=Paxillus involutus ATCC 200175 TaxID=664439 RepID=A0A0C9U4M2_PAXIN|nr:hypothetical protein PAXINDRAFT_156253 [Paxillus involutus ATCC 200175]